MDVLIEMQIISDKTNTLHSIPLTSCTPIEFFCPLFSKEDANTALSLPTFVCPGPKRLPLLSLQQPFPSALSNGVNNHWCAGQRTTRYPPAARYCVALANSSPSSWMCSSRLRRIRSQRSRKSRQYQAHSCDGLRRLRPRLPCRHHIRSPGR